MGAFRRVFHQGNTIQSVEHRADEYELGAGAYTADNVPDAFLGFDWFIQDVSIFDDTEGVVPWDALSVGNPDDPPDQRMVAIDATLRDRARQETKDSTRGGDGRTDELERKLADDSINDAELRELLRLERGL